MLRPTNPKRRTQHVARRSASAFLHAPRIAAKISRPLNTHVAIRWELLGYPREDASKAFERLRLGPFAQWSRYVPVGSQKPRNGQPTYAWVFEATGGLHVHWCVHVEAGQEMGFERMLRRWIKSALGLAELPTHTTVGVQKIPNMHGFKLYLMKGAEAWYAAACNIRRIENQGEVIGKRCGVSTNLSKSARINLEGPWRRGGHQDDPLRNGANS